jgi:hypothetical protein
VETTSSIQRFRHGRVSLAERLAAFFREHPRKWIDGRKLASIAGGYAWRTRVSDLRRPPYSMTLENRLRHIKTTDDGRLTVSEYRCVPAELTPRELVTAVSTAWELRP